MHSGYPASRSFPDPKANSSSLPRRRRAVPSAHLLLGIAVTDVCYHASLSGRRDARAKSISLHAGIFHRARRIAQASRSSIPNRNSDVPTDAVLSQGRCPGKEAFAVCGFLPPQDWAQASGSSPQIISQRMLCFRRGFGLERTALRRCFLSKASVALGKKSCRRAGASWALLSRVPCLRPGFTLPGRTKQTQPQP